MVPLFPPADYAASLVAPPAATVTGDLHDEAFDQMVVTFGPERARVALVVLFCESGFRSFIRNGSGAPYYGLNQMGESELRVLGLSPVQWLSMPAERQIPFVAQFWAEKFGRFGDWMWSDPAHLYGCNFLPARCYPGMPDEHVLTRRGDHDWQNKVTKEWHSYYESNTGLDLVAMHSEDPHRYDVGKDGAIDMHDFQAWIAQRKRGESARWIELGARLESAITRAYPATIVPPGDDDEPSEKV